MVIEWLFVGGVGEGPGLSCHSDMRRELVFENILFPVELQARTNSLTLLFKYNKLIEWGGMLMGMKKL